MELGLKYEKQSSLSLIAYADTDFASYKDKSCRRVSVSGYIIFLTGGPIH